MRLIVLTVLAILVPTLALASGGLAPRQATVDIEATCQGPAWDVFSVDLGGAAAVEATGSCFDRRGGRGFIDVQWRQYPDGRRFVLRLGVDFEAIEVTGLAPLLHCATFGGFELCR